VLLNYLGMNYLTHKLAAIVVCCIVLSRADRCNAADATWTGSGNVDWAIPLNWSATPVPSDGDTATFDNPGNGNTTISVAGITVKAIEFDSSSAAAYTLGTGQINSQTFTLSDSGLVTVNNTVTKAQLFNASINLGNASSSTYTFTNNGTSTLNFNGVIQGGVSGISGVKTLLVDGSGNIGLGRITSGGATGIDIVKTGTGTLTFSAQGDNENVGLTQNGGTVVLNKPTTAFSHALNVSSTLNDGVLRLGGSSGGDAILNSASLTINGGIFDMNAKSEAINGLHGTGGIIYNLEFATVSALILGLGAPMDASFGGTIADNTGGGNTSRVALHKNGSGTQRLTGTNTYTGGTTVNNGGFIIDGSIVSSVTVSGEGWLSGSGSTGNVSFNSGGGLKPGSGVGTLTTGALNLSSFTTLSYDLSTPDVVGSGINDLTNVSGNLTLDGTLNVYGLGNFQQGTYRLMNYTGSLVNNGLDFGEVPAGYTYSIDTATAGQVNLMVAAIPEPSTFVVGGVALLGLAAFRRRRQRIG
jgi:fibronectin-binding autotransporter adhesin